MWIWILAIGLALCGFVWPLYVMIGLAIFGWAIQMAILLACWLAEALGPQPSK